MGLIYRLVIVICFITSRSAVGLELASCAPGAEDRRSIDGMFRVQAHCDRLLWEIPAVMIGRDMLLHTEVSRLWTTDSDLVPGSEADSRLVRWRRRGKALFLDMANRKMSVRQSGAIELGVESVQLGYIVKRFDILGESATGALIIDATPLFTADLPAFALPLKRRFGMAAIDPQRSYVASVKVFADNLRVVFHQTWIPDPRRLFRGAGEEGEAADDDVPPSMQFQFTANLLLLPREPMRARLWDTRVGYFSVPYEEFGSESAASVSRAYIMRYRLEKKDPAAPLSEPVRPIVFYLGREVPERWRPYIKQGVEDWQRLFEGAGFQGAIIAKDAPSPQQDPDWDAEDARYSVIRWIPSVRQRALGPSLVDPRSGEVISSRVLLWNDLLRLVETWYVTHAAALDARATTLPLPEALMGELLRYAVAHEVGHTLGLRHNFKAASAYSVEQLRDPTWTAKWGTTASIMSYGRLNYVAQPGDGASLLPRFGPYDGYAIHWGYHQISEDGPEAQWSALDRLAARALEDPMLRFGGEDRAAEVDPSVTTFVLGSDPIAAADLGLRNVDRVMELLRGFEGQKGQGYERMGELYEALITHRHRQLDAVARLVGGVRELRSQSGRPGMPFTPVDSIQAREAVRFIAQRGLRTPVKLLDARVLRHFVPEGLTDPLHGSNVKLLERLIDPAVFVRLAEATLYSQSGSGYLKTNAPYVGVDLLRDLNAAIFEELLAPKVEIDHYRRELQRDYVHVLLTGDTRKKEHAKALDLDACALHANLERVGPTRTFDSELAIKGRDARHNKERSSEYRAAVRGALAELTQLLSAALPKTQDRALGLHLNDLLKRLSQ